GLEPGRRCGGQVGDLNHIDPVWQSRVQPIPDVGRIKLCCEGDLKELGLTGGPGGSPARGGNLRMRGETSRMRHGQSGTPDSPFHGTCYVPMTREPHPATLSVSDHQPLHRWQRRRPGRPRLLLARHGYPCPPGEPAPRAPATAASLASETLLSPDELA